MAENRYFMIILLNLRQNHVNGQTYGHSFGKLINRFTQNARNVASCRWVYPLKHGSGTGNHGFLAHFGKKSAKLVKMMLKTGRKRGKTGKIPVLVALYTYGTLETLYGTLYILVLACFTTKMARFTTKFAKFTTKFSKFARFTTKFSKFAIFSCQICHIFMSDLPDFRVRFARFSCQICQICQIFVSDLPDLPDLSDWPVLPLDWPVYR